VEVAVRGLNLQNRPSRQAQAPLARLTFLRGLQIAQPLDYRRST
jgi:hypothetical protein